MATKHPINASLLTSICCTTKLSLGVLIVISKNVLQIFFNLALLGFFDFASLRDIIGSDAKVGSVTSTEPTYKHDNRKENFLCELQPMKHGLLTAVRDEILAL